MWSFVAWAVGTTDIADQVADLGRNWSRIIFGGSAFGIPALDQFLTVYYNRGSVAT
jgi:hypothetical protein